MNVLIAKLAACITILTEYAVNQSIQGVEANNTLRQISHLSQLITNNTLIPEFDLESQLEGFYHSPYVTKEDERMTRYLFSKEVKLEEVIERGKWNK